MGGFKDRSDIQRKVLSTIESIHGCEFIEFFTVVRDNGNIVYKVAMMFGEVEWEIIEADLLKGTRPWRNTNHTLPARGFHLYKMFDDEGTLLYVGKSSNIKKRIPSHFSANSIKSEKSFWKYSVRTLEVAECNSAAEMHIQEMYAINKLQPLYNKDGAAMDEITFEVPLPVFNKVWFYRDWMEDTA